MRSRGAPSSSRSFGDGGSITDSGSDGVIAAASEIMEVASAATTDGLELAFEVDFEFDLELDFEDKTEDVRVLACAPDVLILVSAAVEEAADSTAGASGTNSVDVLAAGAVRDSAAELREMRLLGTDDDCTGVILILARKGCQ